MIVLNHLPIAIVKIVLHIIFVKVSRYYREILHLVQLYRSFQTNNPDDDIKLLQLL